MKTLKLKAILTALTFFGVTAIFAQVDSSKSTTDAQASPMATDSAVSAPSPSTTVSDSTVMDHSSTGNMDHSTMSVNPAEDKAAKKMQKAAKKEAKAAKKLPGTGAATDPKQ